MVHLMLARLEDHGMHGLEGRPPCRCFLFLPLHTRSKQYLLFICITPRQQHMKHYVQERRQRLTNEMQTICPPCPMLLELVGSLSERVTRLR